MEALMLRKTYLIRHKNSTNVSSKFLKDDIFYVPIKENLYYDRKTENIIAEYIYSGVQVLFTT